MTRILLISVFCTLFYSSLADAQSRSRNNEPEPKKVYKDSAQRKLSEVALGDLQKEIFAFSEEEASAVQETVRKRDKFLYSAPDGISVSNQIFQIKPRLGDKDEIPHSYCLGIIIHQRLFLSIKMALLGLQTCSQI